MYHSEVDSLTRNDEKDKALGSTEGHQYLGDLGIKLVLDNGYHGSRCHM